MSEVANIILGTDAVGLDPHATLIASILRRSTIPVHVRCFYRGSKIPPDFKAPGLKVEFFEVHSELEGDFPSHVTQPCLDRFLGLRDFDDWDTALILDWDQLFLLDIAEIFRVDLEDDLIGAKLDGRTIESAAQDWFSRSLPESMLELAQGKWPWLGAMMNLKQMRVEGFWDKFSELQQSIGFEEQLTLALAVEGRVTPWENRFNSVYQWDGEPRDDVVLHYSMPDKPWHEKGIPGEELWRAEQTDWNELRAGRVFPALLDECVNFPDDKLLTKPKTPPSTSMFLDYFDRVFVISLHHRQDRRESLRKTFSDLGLIDPDKVEWVRAVDGKLCPHPEYFRAGAGAWGCYQSHLRIVQDAAMSGLGSYLVIEDDAIFSENTGRLLRNFMNQIPDDWDQLFLGGQHLAEPESVPYRPMVLRGTNVTRTHAFALRESAYGVFQQHITNASDYLANGGWHVDHQIGAAHQKELWKTYVPAWWVSGQGAGESNIANQTNPPLWWHPLRYAGQLPFVYLDAETVADTDLKSLVHFGNHPKGGGCVDQGLHKCVGDPQALADWMKEIAQEALSMEMIPGLSHPQIQLDELEAAWGAWVIDSREADLELMSGYPFNGLFRHPVNRNRAKSKSFFMRTISREKW